MATQERAAHQAVTEAREQLERVQSDRQNAGDKPAKRGPGRPPKAPVSPEQAEQALEAATQEHASDDIGPLAMGAMQDLHDHDVTRLGWGLL